LNSFLCQKRRVAMVIAGLLSGSPCVSAEQGYATWYSYDSCRREGNTGRTASGALMRDEALTCAHPALPFGTHLIVHHHQQSVICTVNDRGPGRGPRTRGVIVDLSPAAFSELAPLGRGKIPVMVMQAPSLNTR